VRGYNKTYIVGNLGKDPEMKYLPDGKALTKFSVAVNRKRQDQEFVDWYNVTCWGDLAETTNQYLSKGSAVFVEGRLESREYEGKTYWDLIANNVIFLDRKPESEVVEDDPGF
jgi:single-strand DNA-binding protein